MVKLSSDSLIKLLNAKNLNPTYQHENDQIYIVMNVMEREVPLFFTIRSEGTLLQLLAYLPFALNEGMQGEMGRLLHLLNREIDMPGFGMDEGQKLLFYRLMLPCMDKELDERLCDLYLGAIKVACETFMEAISLLSQGKTTVDHLMKRKDGR